jgi:hypothetical protein
VHDDALARERVSQRRRDDARQRVDEMLGAIAAVDMEQAALLEGDVRCP